MALIRFAKVLLKESEMVCFSFLEFILPSFLVMNTSRSNSSVFSLAALVLENFLFLFIIVFFLIILGFVILYLVVFIVLALTFLDWEWEVLTAVLVLVVAMVGKL